MNLLKYDYEDLKDIKGWMSPRDCVIEMYGGIKPLSKALGLHISTIAKWRNGVIPHKHQYKLLQLYPHRTWLNEYDFTVILIRGMVKK